jgi:glycerophosphoryl diester phosphodiesterase
LAVERKVKTRCAIFNPTHRSNQMPGTNRLILQGHRGARGVLPENTLAGFDYAFDAGVDYVEADINLSADNALILVHDETTRPDLVRVPGGCWVEDRKPWRALPLGIIRSYDVGRIRPGSEYARRFPDQRAIDGARIPLLDDLMELARARPGSRLNLEVKCDPLAAPPRPDIRHFAGLIVDAVRRFDFADRVTVQSFNWNLVAAIRALDATLLTGCLTSEQPDFDTMCRGLESTSPWMHGQRIRDFDGSVPAMVAAMGVDYWSSEYRDLNPGAVSEAHSLGLKVHCWTVNDPDDMKRLISWGVDSIITDYPDVLVEVDGRSVPPARNKT